MSAYFEGESFSKRQLSSDPLEKGEYEGCLFEDCDFRDQHLSGFNFIECRFVNCDFTNCRLGGTGLKDVEFEHCKLMGMNFTEANQFMLKLTLLNCNLRFSSFYEMNLAGSRIAYCELEEADFSEADLSGVDFSESDLTNANFDHTDLSRADLRKALNFAINPEKNKLDKTVVAADNLAGLLAHYPLIIKT